MCNHYELDIFDFDIYSKGISFFYNKRDRIGTFFGLFLTFLYVIAIIILFSYYLSKAINRSDVKSQESTIYSQGLPSINVNPKLFYFAFGLKKAVSFSRFIDERIYYPKVYFIQQKKENGVLVTKEKINLEVEPCDVRKFGEEYKNLFTEGELNNSYCLQDINLTLVGGSKHEKSSFIEIKIHPCVNTTENKNQCKPQNIIDSYLTSSYFSIIIKDIGLNPLNYSFPIIPLLRNLETNVDITMCRESLIYLGIIEVQTDIGLFTKSLKKDNFLEYRKYSQSFYFISETEYHNGKEVFSGQLKLEEYIHVQKREYTKMSEVFSITGGYMQLISTIFSLVLLFTRNLNTERKILNRLFNFNLRRRKLILSIKYEKNLNYLVNFGKENTHSIVPVAPKKILNPYKILNHYSDSKIIKNDNFIKPDNTTATFMKKYNSSYANNFKRRSIISEFKDNHETMHIIRSNIKIPHIKDNNRSKMLMLFNDSTPNELPINNNFRINNKNESLNYSSNNSKSNGNNNKSHGGQKISEKDISTNIDFNIFEYFCYCRKRKYKSNIEIFDFAVNFYKSQMSIINIFNVIFSAQTMMTSQLNKKNHNYFEKIIEIPIIS